MRTALQMSKLMAVLGILTWGCGGEPNSVGLVNPTPSGTERLSKPAVVQNFQAHLAGRTEVPPNDSQAQGQATFQLNQEGTELHYKLIVANIQNVFMAHIHLAPEGVSGPVVVWLYPSNGPPPKPIPGRSDGVLAEGVITKDNLRGPLAGQELSALITEIQNGGAYVNVHTNDFVDPPNTGPGDFPSGEIRGQIQ